MQKPTPRPVSRMLQKIVPSSLLVCAVLASAAAYAITPEQAQKVIQNNVRLGAANGRAAVDLCNFDAQTLARYKTWVAKQSPDPTFDADWTQGWEGGVRLLTLFQNTKKTDPASYEDGRATFCKGIRDDMTS